MIGAIIGDIIGSRFEFKRPRMKSKDFKLFTKDCRFTDDTVLTIATMDAILNKKSFVRCYVEWSRKYSGAGFGGMYRRWFSGDDHRPYNSFGNGSAMRVSPVAMASKDLISALCLAERSASVTHNHPEGIKGACATTTCIMLASKHQDKNIIKDIIQRKYGYNLNQTLNDIRPTYIFNVTCQGSIPQSIICFLEGNSYEDCVRNAISLGGDTDTMGNIVGGIAEAYYGIPNEIKEEGLSYLPQDMIEIINKFYSTYSFNK